MVPSNNRTLGISHLQWENDGKSIAMLDLHRSDQSVSDQKIPNMSLPENGIAILGLYNVITHI
jgi:hypothetical protein